MRIILQCNLYTNVKLMLNTLNWFDIKTFFYMHTMIFIYKIVNDLLPNYLRDQITFVSEIHQYSTRQAHNIYVDTTTKTSSMNSLFHSGLIQFNILNSDIKNSTSVAMFKIKLQKYLRSLS